VFPEKRQAIDYAETRACFRSGEIRVLDAAGNKADSDCNVIAPLSSYCCVYPLFWCVTHLHAVK
jgi:hypothetical protein